MTRITVVGSINADLTVHVHRHPKPGETLLGSGGDILPGGKGANQAVAAALAGADVGFVGAVGSDAYAAPATRILHESGVRMDDVETVDAPTGLAVIAVADDGENSIIVVPGANAAVDAAYVRRHAEAITGAELVLLQGEIPASGIEVAAGLASRVVMNLAPVVEIRRDILLRANPLIVNEHEASLVLSQLGYQPSSRPEALHEAGFPSAVVTLGAKGAVVVDDAGVSEIEPTPVTPVDTTGAGDCFAGVLVAHLAAGSDLRAAARAAAVSAAQSTTRPGAQTSYRAHEDARKEKPHPYRPK